MLFKLIYFFQADISWLNVFRYITFRTILTTLTSLVIFFILGVWAINRLRAMQVGQYVRDDGPPNHINKVGTPTMGGCFILPVIIASTVFWAEPNNVYVWLVMFVIICFGLIGFVDDYLKNVRKSSLCGLRFPDLAAEE